MCEEGWEDDAWLLDVPRKCSVPTVAFNVVLWLGVFMWLLVLGRQAYIARQMSWT
jgi:hypothetical protein